jgi:hypothetical protein
MNNNQFRSRHVLAAAVAFSAALCLSIMPAPPTEAQTIPVCSPAKKCAITWQANTEPDMMDYRLLLSQTAGQYDVTKPALVVTHPNTGGSTANLGTLEDGQYFLTLVAVEQAGNVSPFSNEVAFRFDGPPGAPVMQIIEVMIP